MSSSCARCGRRGNFSERLGWVACSRCYGDEEPEGEGRRPVPGARLTAYSGIEPERVDWLWPERVPLGMLTLLVGDPGLGKSLLTCDLAAKVSRAGGDVVLSSAEDHAGATVRPRLEAAGADLAHVHRGDYTDGDGLPRTLELPDDVGALAAKVAEVKARLLVIDPLTAHLPESVNSWRDQSVRRALAPLHRLAEEHHCAVVVVAHLNKSTGADPLYRTGGSIAIPAAVRSALLLARDPEDPEGERGSRRILAHHKCNVAALADSLTYEVEPVGETARLKATGSSGVQARDLLDAPGGDEATERDEAAEWLKAELEDGPLPVKQIKMEANEAGVSWRTIERAKGQLGVQAERVGEPGKRGGGRWVWTLPSKAATSRPPDPYLSGGGLNPNGSTEPDGDGAADLGRHGSDMAVLNGTDLQETPPKTSPNGDGKATEIERLTAPLCRYPSHRPTDFKGEGGQLVCGTCHPRPGGAA